MFPLGTMGSPPNAACAACKFQRRKCAAECPLAPWFPPDQPKRFANVHKLFGVANVLKLFRENAGKIEDLVKSIVYEADARERDPVHGAYGTLQVLTRQAVSLEDERKTLQEQLAIMLQEEAAQTRHTQAVYLPSGNSNPTYDFTSTDLGPPTLSYLNSYAGGGLQQYTPRTMGSVTNTNSFAQQQQAHYGMHMGAEMFSGPNVYSGGGYPSYSQQQQQQGYSQQQAYSQKRGSSIVNLPPESSEPYIRRSNSDVPYNSADHVRDFLSLRNNTHRGLY